MTQILLSWNYLRPKQWLRVSVEPRYYQLEIKASGDFVKHDSFAQQTRPERNSNPSERLQLTVFHLLTGICKGQQRGENIFNLKNLNYIVNLNNINNFYFSEPI